MSDPEKSGRPRQRKTARKQAPAFYFIPDGIQHLAANIRHGEGCTDGRMCFAFGVIRDGWSPCLTMSNPGLVSFSPLLHRIEGEAGPRHSRHCILTVRGRNQRYAKLRVLLTLQRLHELVAACLGGREG